MIEWETAPPPKSRVRIEHIGSFNARGMQRVFCRSDGFGRKAWFNLDIWRDRKGNVLARFWSRNADVDDLSFAIHWILPGLIPERGEGDAFSDAWLPQAFRHKYEEWIKDEW